MTDVVAAGEVTAWRLIPGAESHEYTCGVAGVDVGSPQYPGTVLLAISGILGVGPGMVRYLGPVPRDLVVGRFPSVVLTDRQVRAVVAGSGWSVLVDAGPHLREALKQRVPLVIDADALRLLPADLPAETLLTSHVGRLARLLGVERGEIEADLVAAAALTTGRFGATAFLKEAV